MYDFQYLVNISVIFPERRRCILYHFRDMLLLLNYCVDHLQSQPIWNDNVHSEASLTFQQCVQSLANFVVLWATCWGRRLHSLNPVKVSATSHFLSTVSHSAVSTGTQPAVWWHAGKTHRQGICSNLHLVCSPYVWFLILLDRKVEIKG